MKRLSIKTMRDAFIYQVYKDMRRNKDIFFLSADMGAAVLDDLRVEFKQRFINVGVAEQNLVNVATGLALEKYTVYAYAIASFLMRAYEQVRIDLALTSQIKDLNVNLIGVGAGISYDLSGPSHHCLEDLSIMRTLPNITVFSPSDYLLAEKFVAYCGKIKKPKYIRLDGKQLPAIYPPSHKFDWQRGYSELAKGKRVCLVTTGFMTQKALQVIRRHGHLSVGLIDVFLLKPINEESLADALSRYKCVITMEEGFIGKGGLDSLISDILHNNGLQVRLKSMGFKDSYVYAAGSRDYLYKLSMLSEKDIVEAIARP